MLGLSTKLLKKVEIGVAHDKLTEDLEKLTEAHKALESDLMTLNKLHEQLQTQLNQTKFSSTPTSSCDDAHVIEENARLKKELDILKGKGPMVNPLPTQSPIVVPLPR